MAKPLVRLIQGLTQAKQRRRRWGSKVVYFLVSTYLTAILLLFGVSSRSFSTPGPLPKIKLLFFDDEDLAYRSGTKRILHQLTKIQHPGYATRPINYAFEGLIPAHAVHSDRLWTARKEYESSISYVSVYKRPSSTNGFYPYDTNFPYQMWYQCYSQSKSQDKRKQCVVGYAESADGIVWIKPNIGRTNFNEGDTGTNIYRARQADGTAWPGRYSWSSTRPADGTNPASGAVYATNENNIVMIGSGAFGDRYWNSVVVEPYDPNTNRRYKMVFTDFEKGPSLTNASYNDRGTGTQVAFSPDGINWIKYPDTNFPSDLTTSTNSINDGSFPTNVHRIAYGAASYTNSITNIPTGHPPTVAEHATNVNDHRDAGSHQYWGIPISMADAQDVFIDPDGAWDTNGNPVKKYIITGKLWVNSPYGVMAWKHAMGRIESTNFVDWTNLQTIMTTDDIDDQNTNFASTTNYDKYVTNNGGSYTNYTYSVPVPAWDGHNVKFHTSPVFKYEGVYLSLNQLYYQPQYTQLRSDNDEIIEIELMESRNTTNWTRFRYSDYGVRFLPRGYHDRVPANPGDPSDPNGTGSKWIFVNVPASEGTRNEWDAKGIVSDASPIVEPTEIKFYYAALGNGGVGLATIKRDRLVGITSVYPTGTTGSSVGQVTSRVVDLTGYGAIAINAVATGSTAAEGQITTELLDSNGHLMAGYSGASAVALYGDSDGSSTNSANVPGDPLSRLVTWSGTAGLPQQKCMVRVHLNNAELFSISLIPSP